MYPRYADPEEIRQGLEDGTVVIIGYGTRLWNYLINQGASSYRAASQIQYLRETKQLAETCERLGLYEYITRLDRFQNIDESRLPFCRLV